ncbi:MAG: hypothetical protein A2750_00980 [Candidatus Yanofskybacteria bacterium RIFCSPHIGHO2_01_FULL_45_42]|uniref:Uncharacterized protein n=2 Tax=Candidatus Yanofskyibacteriota TaxID=1752733 RepID=A0A1F8F6Z1_9BACT|nr:MAG: hypothetical protein A2750_00980 [Candidatus Yanofskybacteria bacterium RIFCSPHIGHO2_01_FULL_45_42]OGN15487.1 MAG: hypothetical protein A3C81_01170 [Candidatus Yanofskybacteria bacterium RIFCSPHIGHO2_02_FULL_46_19]OGN27194.1 MAG: hypothetical protein A3B17_01080 [Candidatus Yanofskybacteria bacterium RIFCSPLOWO2_01_FULL_45_72]
MKWLDEIHKQPKGARELLFALCVVATLSLIGMAWFRSFDKQLFALLNPDVKIEDQKHYAVNEAPSIFASIGQLFGDLKAQISGIFQEDYLPQASPENYEDIQAKPLPLPRDKTE